MPFAALTTIDTPSYFGHPVVLFGGAIALTASGARIANELQTSGVGYAEATDEDVYLLIGGDHIARLATAEDDGPIGRDGWLRTGKLHLGDFEAVGYAYEKDLVDAGFARRFETLEELADATRADLATLQREIADVAAAQRDSAPDRVGREWQENLLEHGPYLWIGPFRGVLVLCS